MHTHTYKNTTDQTPPHLHITDKVVHNSTIQLSLRINIYNFRHKTWKAKMRQNRTRTTFNTFRFNSTIQYETYTTVGRNFHKNQIIKRATHIHTLTHTHWIIWHPFNCIISQRYRTLRLPYTPPLTPPPLRRGEIFRESFPDGRQIATSGQCACACRLLACDTFHDTC